MSLSRWKELAQRKSKAGQAINELYDNITEEKIRSKTTDAAIAKTFRLDKLDRLDQIAEQTKPRERRRFPAPRIKPDQNIDYAPEVDPYEDMDVEGLLNLEDYIAPQAEKQIAKKPPHYQMDPSFWQIPDDPPPPYEEIPDLEDVIPEETLAIEAPEEEVENDTEDNRILDSFGLPNFNDVDLRLAEPEMNVQKKVAYLKKIKNDANKTIKRVSISKTHAKNKFAKNKISSQQLDEVYTKTDRTMVSLRRLRDKVGREYKKITGSKMIGRGVFFYNGPEELFQKLSLILAEMQAGNTNIEMRNMGQNILDTLLKNKYLNKSNYGKIVTKYFSI